ncbi:MFS transporter, partial [Amycolatopsis sp. NPDC000673]
LLGQPAGSALFGLLRWAPFAATAVTHLLSLVSLLLIRKPLRSETTRARRPWRHELAEGVAWTWRQRFLRVVLTLIAVSNIPFQVVPLALMVLVRDSGSSPAVIGLVTGVGGVGGLIGAVNGTWWMRRLNLNAIVVGGLAVWALLMAFVAFTSGLVLLSALFAAIAYVGGLFNVCGGVYTVRITPDELMGRVGGVATFVSSGTNALGPLVGGVLLDSWGTGRTVGAMSIVMALLAVAAVLSPTVRTVSGTEHGRRLV